MFRILKLQSARRLFHFNLFRFASSVRSLQFTYTSSVFISRRFFHLVNAVTVAMVLMESPQFYLRFASRRKNFPTKSSGRNSHVKRTRCLSTEGNEISINSLVQIFLSRNHGCSYNYQRLKTIFQRPTLNLQYPNIPKFHLFNQVLSQTPLVPWKLFRNKCPSFSNKTSSSPKLIDSPCRGLETTRSQRRKATDGKTEPMWNRRKVRARKYIFSPSISAFFSLRLLFPVPSPVLLYTPPALRRFLFP